MKVVEKFLSVRLYTNFFCTDKNNLYLPIYSYLLLPLHRNFRKIKFQCMSKRNEMLLINLFEKWAKEEEFCSLVSVRNVSIKI